MECRRGAIGLAAGLTLFARPSLHIEPIRQDDGGFKPGRRFFSAVTFRAFVNPFDYVGSFDTFSLYISETEAWMFYNARITLLPCTKIEDSHFVMVYERCEMLNTGE